jgi:hypothetical protein
VLSALDRHRCAAINLQRLTNLGLDHHDTWASA